MRRRAFKTRWVISCSMADAVNNIAPSDNSLRRCILVAEVVASHKYVKNVMDGVQGQGEEGKTILLSMRWGSAYPLRSFVTKAVYAF